MQIRDNLCRVSVACADHGHTNFRCPDNSLVMMTTDGGALRVVQRVVPPSGRAYMSEKIYARGAWVSVQADELV